MGSLTITTPAPSLTSSGGYTVSGSISCSPGYHVSGFGWTAPFATHSGQWLDPTKFFSITFPMTLADCATYSAANNGGTYAGSLFLLNIPANAINGTYQFDLLGSLPSFMILTTNNAGQVEQLAATFEITYLATMGPGQPESG